MIVLALFTLSGFAGLVLESVFFREFALVLGSTTAATSLVLAAFLGGLSGGAAWLGPLADRTARPLRLYGLLEIGAGVAAAAAVALLGPGRSILVAPLEALGTGRGARLVEFALAAALVLPATLLMGGTLPALGRYAVREPEALLGPLGRLYGLNTLGGAAGVFVAGFYLYESIGVSRSGYLAAGLLLGVGAAALGLDLASPAGSAPASPDRLDPPRSASRASGAVVASLAAAAIGGGCVLGYEVVWTRLLALPMRSFSYSFSLMLSLFLAGLVVGSLLAAVAGPRIRRPVAVLGWTHLATGAYVAASVLWLPDLLPPPAGGSFEGFLARAAARASVVVIPPTLGAGLALLLAARGVGPSRERIGRDIGAVYALNTAGAVAGAIVTGLVLLPRLGAPRALGLLAAMQAAMGALVLVASRARPVSLAVAAVLAGASAVPAWLPTQGFVQAFLDASRGRERIAELLFFHEGATDTVAIVKKDYGFFDPGAKSLLTNGVAMSASVKPVRRYMAAEGHLPVLLAAEPRRAIAIGIGTGITLGALVSHGRLEAIDAVELSEGVLRGLPYFDAENGRAYLDPRVRLHRDDGRRFLERTAVHYDVITLEPPPPIVAGSSNLYSLDFYRLAAKRLAPGGVIAQWLPLHAQSLASARMTARTFLEAFPHAQLWLPSIRDAVLLGSSRPLELPVERLLEASREPAARASLEGALLETPEALLATYLLDREGIERWSQGAPVITDDRPLMEFFRHHGRNMETKDIGTLLELPQADWGWVRGIDTAPELAVRVLEENRALRLGVRSEVESNRALGVEAARLSRGTRFYLYRLGCAPEQLDRIDPPNPAWASHGRFCQSLAGPDPS